MKYILALTPLWVGHVVSIPAPQGQVPTDWTTKKCSDPFINDAAAPAAARWNASAAAHAWNAIELAWNQEAPPPGDTALNLSAYVGNFFHTKDRLSCENAADNPCDDTILCSDVTPAYPAGFMIVNSMVALHSIHKTVYDSLTPALALMQSHISTFQGTFAPSIPDNEAIIKEILDVFALLFAVSSAFVWNVVAKEAAWFSDDNYRGFSKDSANALIALGINSGKDNLPSSNSDIQGKLSDVLGTYFGFWEKAQLDYLSKTFQGSADSLTTLSKAFHNGLILSVPTPDLGSVGTEVQHIMYSKMVPVAWNLAPGKYMPFILKTSEPCSSTATGVVHGIMDDSTAAQTHVCYDGFTFYVVNPYWLNNRGIVFNVKLNSLPGGTFENMNDPMWAGLKLDDFVISSWEGYKKNGMKNGYSASADDGSATDILFENGVQTPGVAVLPLCEYPEFLHNIGTHNYDSRYPGFPCNQN